MSHNILFPSNKQQFKQYTTIVIVLVGVALIGILNMITVTKYLRQSNFTTTTTTLSSSLQGAEGVTATSLLTPDNDDLRSANWTCLGWKDHKFYLGPKGRLRPCHMIVSPRRHGHCVLRNDDTGQLVTVYHQTPRYTKSLECARPLVQLLRLPCRRTRRFFSCHRVSEFLQYKHRAYAFEPDIPIVVSSTNTSDTIKNESATAALGPQSSEPTPNNHKNNERGIVMQVYGSMLPSVYAIVQVLRQVHSCTLPIELWSNAGDGMDESNPLLQKLLADPHGITLRINHDTTKYPGYMSKPYGIAYSQFTQVLALDSDNYPLINPTYLFDTPEYQSTGAMFWKDFWVVTRNDFFFMKRDSVIWELLGIPSDSPARTEMEQESGQLLIHRGKSRRALTMLLFLAQTFHEWFKPLNLILGDKDLFRIAFHMTNTPFHYIAQPPGVAGYVSPSNYRVCGSSILQYDPQGEPIFLHRNFRKIVQSHDALPTSKVWEGGLTFVGKEPGSSTSTEAIEKYYQIEFANDIPVVPRAYNGTNRHTERCFHPKPRYQKYFEFTDFQGTAIDQLEDQILAFAQEGFDILNNNQNAS
jgi:hypothetical protein